MNIFHLSRTTLGSGVITDQSDPNSRFKDFPYPMTIARRYCREGLGGSG